MILTEHLVKEYRPEEGKVLDYKEPPMVEDENGEMVEQHLNAVRLFLAEGDSIDNYVEVDANETNPTT